MATRRRGSTKIAARTPSAARLSDADVRRVIALSQRRGIKIVDWWIYGQPAPDAIGGVFQIAPRQAGSLIQALLAVKGIRSGIEVFPLGIPFPRDVQIRFEAGARVR